jgi:ABC-type antimicrobial peptide transport system permease subunit
VTAVFENLKNNTPDKFDYLINWENFLENNGWAREWGNNGPRTYVLLRKDADPAKVEAKIKKFLDNYNKEQSANFYIHLRMQRYSDMYLNSNFKNGQIVGGRIEYVRLFSIVAIFILLIACINFMNLTTARSVKRAKEIGIRKVAGAFRTTLIGQFIGEAILITFLAVIIAFLLVFILLPAFNGITGKQIEMPLNQPMFWISLLSLTLVTGFISGSYPALFLSAFQPIRVLKGTMKFSNGATWLRKGLVVFQFMLSIVLIIGTIVVSRQINFIQTVNLGYDRDNLVYIPLEGDLTGKYTLFKQEAIKLPGIKMVSRITQTPTDISNGTGGVEWEGKDPNSMPQFVQASVGYEFAKTVNLKILQGRDFSKDFATDSAAYLVNEAALKIINYKDPIGKPLTFWQQKGVIIGVLKDFHFNSLHEPIRPIVIRLRENETWGSAMVRIEEGKTQQALAGLEKLCKQLNPQFPFTHQFSDEEYLNMYKSEQVVGKLSNCFAFLAILISCLGLLGLAMFTAEQRTKEFGVRKVLGASVSSLFNLLAKDFLVLVSIAFFIAAPLAWWASNNWLSNFAYQASIGWWVFAFAGIMAILIALITVSFQAIKAAVANPVKSLRSE